MYYNVIASSASLSTFIEKQCPEFESLDRLNNKWEFFGTLTYAKEPPLPSTQVRDCIQLFDTLGQLNHSDPDLLQWVVRVEYSESDRYHMHFLLGADRVTVNAHHHPLTVGEACEYLTKHWTHGRCLVEPYNPAEDGVGYITKGKHDPHVGLFVFSNKLKRALKNLPHSDWRENECKEIDRYIARGLEPDSLELELLVKLRRVRVPVCMFDEAQRK